MHDKSKSRSAPKRKKPPANKSAAARKTAPLPDAEPSSICVECAKHPSLKKFVRKHGSTGYECGICHRSDLIASAPDKHEALSSLVRALVRFHYDEWSYNPHWGGEDRPSSFFTTRIRSSNTRQCQDFRAMPKNRKGF